MEHTNDQEQPKTSTLHLILPKTERSSVPNDLPTTLPPSKPSISSDGSTYKDVSEEHSTLSDDLTHEDVNGEYDMEWWKHGSDMSPATNDQPAKLRTFSVQVPEEDPGAGWTLDEDPEPGWTVVRSRRQLKTEKDADRRPSPALETTDRG